jgi:NitT/TauT family transport system substrate-binding protein
MVCAERARLAAGFCAEYAWLPLRIEPMRPLIVSLLLVACGACSPARDTADEPAGAARPPKLEPVTLQLNWFPEAEHGGYYAALVKGFYRQAGLDVTIHPGGSSSPVVQEVATGRTQFGVANADDILFARAQQAHVVAVMAPLDTSPRCLIVHEKAGIKNFADLHDLTLAVKPGAAFAEYLRLKVPLSGVQIVPYTGSVQQFLRDEHYVQQGYVFSEPYVARENGGDPQVLMLADLGFNPYTSLLFTTDKLLGKQPDLVRRMVAASVRGWADYLEDPEPTNERIHALNPEIGLPALAYGATAIRPLVETEAAQAGGIGGMQLERWQTLAEQLVETGQLKPGAVAPQDAFSTKFLPAK